MKNSLKFVAGIESLRALGSRWDFFLTSTSLINGIKKQYLVQTNMTWRHLHLWLLPDIISLYLSTANSSVDVLEGRVGSNIFPYNPLQILGEPPDQSRELFEWTPRENEYNYFLNCRREKSKLTSMGQISTRTIFCEQFGGQFWCVITYFWQQYIINK